MSLSERFGKLPAPKYESMPIKQNGGKTQNRVHAKKRNNIIYDEAIILASEPQIIRPNVTNLVM
eukprot:UN04271